MSKAPTQYESRLYRAIRQNDINNAKTLLSNYSTEFHETISDERYFDNKCIIIALGFSRVEMARLLIEKNFRVCRNPDNEPTLPTVLEYAVGRNDTDLVKLILQKGASRDIFTTNIKNKTPLHIAIDKNYLTIIDLLLPEIDHQLFESMHFLEYIVKNRKTGLLELLIARGFSMNKRNSENETAFCSAMRSNAFKSLDCLVSNHPVNNINPDNYDDMAPIYIAIIRDNLDVIKKYANSNLPINNVLKLSEKPWYGLEDLSGSTLLHVAVQYNNLQIFSFLLAKGAYVFFQNANRSSPLHLAFEKKEKCFWKTWKQFENNNYMIDAMLATNLHYNFNPVNDNGLTHFHIACSRDETAIVEHFLKLGALINQPVNTECPRYKGYTPLHFAAKFRCIKVIDLLLRYGADLKQRDFKGMTALHVAAKEPCVESVRLLLEYGADANPRDCNGNSPVHWAFKEKNFEIIDLLLSVENVTLSNPVNNEGLSHFHIICTRDRADIVEKMIKIGVPLNVRAMPQKPAENQDLYAYYWSSFTPLHFAAVHNRAQNVQLLLNSGADVRFKDFKGLTPLHAACKYTFALFEEFINYTLQDLSNEGKIKLQPKPVTDVNSVNEEYTVERNSLEEIIDQEELNINWTKNRIDQLEIINLLLNFKSDINSIDREGNSPIYYSCSSIDDLPLIMENNMNCAAFLWNKIVKGLSAELYDRRMLIIDIILKFNVNLDKCYRNGSILCYICSKKSENNALQIMEKFLNKGANVDATNGYMTPLHQAVKYYNEDFVEILIDFGANVNMINYTCKSTPLLTATSTIIKECSIRIVEMLINGGAYINARRSDGQNALHNLASSFKDSPYIGILISMLIKLGADVNSQDSQGLTPLHVACEQVTCAFPLYSDLNKVRTARIKEILKYAPDLSIEDNKGRSVFCYLHDEQTPELVNRIQEYILKMNAIGLLMCPKILKSHGKFVDRLQASFYGNSLLSDEQKKEFLIACQLERETLCDKKIHKNCSLYDVIFKSETDMINIARNFDFEAIVESESFDETYPHYGFLIRLKYQAGLDRANLLPTANNLFNILAGKPVMYVCCEYICRYFTNVELRECFYVLSSIFSDNAKSANNDNNKQPTTICEANKRQKVC